MNNENILEQAAILRRSIGDNLHDKLTAAIYADAGAIAARAVTHNGEIRQTSFDQRLDRVLTSRVWGFPLMLLMLMTVLWLTIAGANVPSAMLADLLQGTVYNALHGFANVLTAPAWLSGFLIDGVPPPAFCKRKKLSNAAADILKSSTAKDWMIAVANATRLFARNSMICKESVIIRKT
ncbi:MAG: hypothetical protein WKF92_03635 [Pyrinomonadaceae bacterium]